MKIYINGRFLEQPVTGVQRYGRELLNAWDKLVDKGEIDRRNVELRILAPRGMTEAPNLRHAKLCQVGRLRSHLWEQLELPFYARDGLLFSPGNLHPLLSPFLGRGVVTIHDLAYRLSAGAYSRAFRLGYGILIPAALRRADAVITVSEAEKRNIIKRFPACASHIHVVHHGMPRVESTIESEANTPRYETKTHSSKPFDSCCGLAP